LGQGSVSAANEALTLARRRPGHFNPDHLLVQQVLHGGGKVEPADTCRLRMVREDGGCIIGAGCRTDGLALFDKQAQQSKERLFRLAL
jgi:hypothetical protein